MTWAIATLLVLIFLGFAVSLFAFLYIVVVLILLLAGSMAQLRCASTTATTALLSGALAAAWISFYLLALAVITVQVSPYVYALPHHRCPFDLLRYPYLAIGLPLYLFLRTRPI